MVMISWKHLTKIPITYSITRRSPPPFLHLSLSLSLSLSLPPHHAGQSYLSHVNEPNKQSNHQKCEHSSDPPVTPSTKKNERDTCAVYEIDKMIIVMYKYMHVIQSHHKTGIACSIRRCRGSLVSTFSLSHLGLMATASGTFPPTPPPSFPFSCTEHTDGYHVLLPPTIGESNLFHFFLYLFAIHDASSRFCVTHIAAGIKSRSSWCVLFGIIQPRPWWQRYRETWY